MPTLAAVLVWGGRAGFALALLVGVVLGLALSEGPNGLFPPAFLFGFLGLGTLSLVVTVSGHRLRGEGAFSHRLARIHGFLVLAAVATLGALLLIG